jgi:hypothetical protein
MMEYVSFGLKLPIINATLTKTLGISLITFSLVLFTLCTSPGLNAYAQQQGGAAKSGEAIGGAASGPGAKGGTAESGKAIGGAATGSGAAGGNATSGAAIGGNSTNIPPVPETGPH